MSFDSNVDRVCQKFQDRAYLGYQKYGTTTERKDITTHGWLTHLQEELMDAVVYIERLKQEVALVELSRIDQELFGEHYVSSNSQERLVPQSPTSPTLLKLRQDADVPSPLPANCHWGLGACLTSSDEFTVTFRNLD